MHNWVKIIREMLPNSFVWQFSLSKYLEAFYYGLIQEFDRLATCMQRIEHSVFPSFANSSSLTLWINQFQLVYYGLSEDNVRKALKFKWRARGGQDAQYIIDFFKIAGYEVGVYENFVDPPIDPRTLHTLNSYSRTCVGPPIINATLTCGGTNNNCVAPLGKWYYLVNDTNDTFLKYPVNSDPKYWINYVFLAAGGAGHSMYSPLRVAKELEEVILSLMLQIKPVHTRWMLNIDFT